MKRRIALAATAHLDKEEFNNAIADVSKAIEINPNEADHYRLRAWVYLKAGNAAAGLPDADRSLELRPNHAFTLYTRGRIFEALGKREEAIIDYYSALANDANFELSKRALKRLGVAR